MTPQQKLDRMRERYVGHHYGKLEITDIIMPRGPFVTSRYVAICDCECGTKGKKVPFYFVAKKNGTRSCCCTKRERGHRQMNHGLRAEILSLHKGGRSARDIASMLKISRQRIYQLLESEGIDTTTFRGKAVEKHRALVLAMLEAGDSYQAIASKLGHHTVTLRQWCKDNGIKKPSVTQAHDHKLAKLFGTKPNPNGLLTLVGIAGRDKNSRVIGIFDCDCGTKGFKAILDNVKKRMTRSCSCLRRGILDCSPAVR